MKIYFDGCAKTKGVFIKPNWHKRYSTLLCDKLGAEEYNIARSGGSNRRLVRNLLEHDLSNYDMFVIQMTKKERFEWYDKKKERWHNMSPQLGLDKDKVSRKAIHHTIMFYYDQIYSDEMGYIDEKICFNAIKSLLQNKKHIIIYMGHRDCSAPVDLHYIKGKNYYENFDEKSHEKICNDLIGHCNENIF